MRMGHAIVAVVAPVATADGSPLFGADGGLRCALARARNLAAVLRLFVVAKEAGCAGFYGAIGAARTGCGGGGVGR